MDRTIYMVFLKDPEGNFASGTWAIYVDDPGQALAHANRNGGTVIRVKGKEMSGMDEVKG